MASKATGKEKGGSAALPDSIETLRERLQRQLEAATPDQLKKVKDALEGKTDNPAAAIARVKKEGEDRAAEAVRKSDEFRKDLNSAMKPKLIGAKGE